MLARFGALLGIRCLCRHLGKHGAKAAAQGILFLVHYDVILLTCKAHAITLTGHYMRGRQPPSRKG